MSFLGALAATVPVLGSLWDPDLAKQRQLEEEEKRLLDFAYKAEMRGDLAGGQRSRAQARISHNQRIRLAQDVERGKAAECRRHGWTKAADDHELKAQQLEYEVWADTAALNASVDAAAPSNNASNAPLPTQAPVSAGTSWPPQQHGSLVAPLSSSPQPTPPPPAYSDIYPESN